MRVKNASKVSSRLRRGLAPRSPDLPLLWVRALHVTAAAALHIMMISHASAQSFGTLANGQPVVATGSGAGAVANSSAVVFDATQFTGGTDLCGAVSAACQAAASTSGVKFGADIDARAFATSGSNQVCSATTANAMLTNCSSGGKVLLGSYTLWLPLAPTAAGTSSPPGAVLVLPNNFGGFRGVGRGGMTCHDTDANCSAANTPTSTSSVIAACTGTNIPINGCEAPSTSRIWTITSTLPTLAGGNYYVKVTSSGMNLVAGEPVRIDQSSSANNNGAWRVCTPSTSGIVQGDPNCPATPSSTVVYVVGLSSTSSCSASCGNIYGEIPLIDIGIGGAPSFGQRVENLTIDCVGVPTCVPIRSLAGNEQSGFRDIQLTGSLERGFDIHTVNAQNGGPLTDLQIEAGTKIGGTGQTPCGAGTTGFFVGENGPRQLSGNISIVMANCVNVWAPTGNVTGPVTAGGYIDTSQLSFAISNLHCENTEKCLLIGQDILSNAVDVRDSDGMITSPSSCVDSTHHCIAQTGAYAGGPSSVIDISSNFASTVQQTGHYRFSNLRKSSAAANAIEDNVLSVAATDSVVGTYNVDRDCSTIPCRNSLLTSSTSVQSIVPEGFSIPQGTLTANSPFISQSATWNSASTTFTNLLTNVTNTSSSSGSLLVNHEVGGSSV